MLSADLFTAMFGGERIEYSRIIPHYTAEPGEVLCQPAGTYSHSQSNQSWVWSSVIRHIGQEGFESVYLGSGLARGLGLFSGRNHNGCIFEKSESSLYAGSLFELIVFMLECILQHATLLLEAVLESRNWTLARDVVRHLKAIGKERDQSLNTLFMSTVFEDEKLLV